MMLATVILASSLALSEGLEHSFGQDGEFIEVENRGVVPVRLDDVSVSYYVSDLDFNFGQPGLLCPYTFPAGTILYPGEVIALGNPRAADLFGAECFAGVLPYNALGNGAITLVLEDSEGVLDLVFCAGPSGRHRANVGGVGVVPRLTVPAQPETASSAPGWIDLPGGLVIIDGFRPELDATPGRSDRPTPRDALGLLLDFLTAFRARRADFDLDGDTDILDLLAFLSFLRGER